MRPPQLEILLEPSVFVSLAALSWTSTLLRCLSHFWLSVIARCFQKYLGLNRIFSICFILTLLWAVWSIDPVLCGMEIVVIMSPIKTQNSTQSNRNYLLLWKERKFVEHFFCYYFMFISSSKPDLSFFQNGTDFKKLPPWPFKAVFVTM